MINTAGEAVASYTYDAFGNILSASGNLANINPLRYRGYYYDTETGFYYLQSRYYDPMIGRFINADSYASTGQGFLGYNMFAYCNNNPVIRADPVGTDAIIIIDEDDAAGGNGHYCFLVQDDCNTWYYYSFASIRGSFRTVTECAIFGFTDGYVTNAKIGSAEGFELTTKEGIVDCLNDSGCKNTADILDYCVYLAGDFSKTAEKCKADVAYQKTWWGKHFPLQYSLLGYNCMHYTLDSLSYSDSLSNNQRAAMQRQLSWGIIPKKWKKNVSALGVLIQ